jgi:diacylglycerol O-acyltransferase / wax synthase
VGKLAGGTLNDVVVAACSGALRRFLLDHGEPVANRTLMAMVPVSVRADDARGTMLGNQVSMMMVDLPVDEPDPVTTLARVHEQTTQMKHGSLVGGAQTMVAIAGELPFGTAALTRLFSERIPMNLVITNIPGPPIPLYIRGAKLLAAYPYVEVVDNQGLTIAVVSYEGEFFFGISADRDVIPDLDVLAGDIEKAFAALADAVEARHAGRNGGRGGSRRPARSSQRATTRNVAKKR